MGEGSGHSCVCFLLSSIKEVQKQVFKERTEVGEGGGGGEVRSSRGSKMCFNIVHEYLRLLHCSTLARL